MMMESGASVFRARFSVGKATINGTLMKSGVVDLNLRADGYWRTTTSVQSYALNGWNSVAQRVVVNMP